MAGLVVALTVLVPVRNWLGRPLAIEDDGQQQQQQHQQHRVCQSDKVGARDPAVVFVAEGVESGAPSVGLASEMLEHS